MRELDKNDDGFVSFDEILDSFRNETVWSAEEEVLESFVEADLDRDGVGWRQRVRLFYGHVPGTRGMQRQINASTRPCGEMDALSHPSSETNPGVDVAKWTQQVPVESLAERLHWDSDLDSLPT